VLYVSPIKNYRQTIHPGIPKLRHPVTMEVLEWEIHPLAAAFGKLGDEQTIFNPVTQTYETVADIVTGVYDTEVAQQQNGWTDMERKIVEDALDKEAAAKPVYVRKVVPIHVPATAPWQTYDQAAPDKIVVLAEELGLVPEALRYERENANRAAVLSALEVALKPEDESRTAPLTKVDVHADKPDMRIGKAPKTTRGGIVADTPGLEGLKEAPEPEESVGSTIRV
jgi:hypothetical protein